ncbi:MAG: bifunctional oligoribonuclease/PAP phosphatase NrnA [Planctomycetota bacterium]|nr:MAG: bifunctional oligoribonuclease/PAP phosphatase NrnA [Planctomycetota bacterium]
MPIDWQPLVEILRTHQRFVISSHVRPDADAIGSEIGLCGLLEQMGKQVRIVNPSATPAHLGFLDPANRIQKIGEGITSEEICNTDVHLIVDTSAWQQLTELRKTLETTSARKVVIDHHLSSDHLGAELFKDTTAAAAGVLICELADALEITPTVEQATALFSAIATDTGWFRFPNVDARTLKRIAWLIELGVQPHLVYRELYEKSSLARLHLHGRVLSRVSLEFEGAMGMTFVLQKDFDETGAHPSDTEDLVNDCLTIVGTRCAVIFVEQKSGQVKVSFRSRSGLDVASVAEQFGGGGHRLASGAMMAGPLDRAKTVVLEAIQKALAIPGISDPV